MVHANPMIAHHTDPGTPVQQWTIDQGMPVGDNPHGVLTDGTGRQSQRADVKLVMRQFRKEGWQRVGKDDGFHEKCPQMERLVSVKHPEYRAHWQYQV
jgi:hypothetical protein